MLRSGLFRAKASDEARALPNLDVFAVEKLLGALNRRFVSLALNLPRRTSDVLPGFERIEPIERHGKRTLRARREAYLQTGPALKSK